MPSGSQGHMVGGEVWTAQRPRAKVTLYTHDSRARPRACLSYTVGGRQVVQPLSPNTLAQRQGTSHEKTQYANKIS